MARVAVLQFPGNNSEYETRRALWDAGMDADFFRWNEDPAGLDAFDGFVIPGGFSYEDRGRSGLIASMDPIMQEIRRQADKGKPVLGICNGAQILVESGLVPGGPNHELLMSLARNKRMKNGELLGVGFYNENIYVRCDAPRRCAFTLDYQGGEVEQCPVAHGEGRFTTSIPGLLEKLRENNQIVFRYCTPAGELNSDFPVNPNGAMDNAAAICNPRGNVMAIMPHPERAPAVPMPKIFSSMRLYIEGQKVEGEKPELEFADHKPALENYVHKPDTIELYVQLKITDNEAQTIENALRHRGLDVHIRKWTHYEIENASGDQEALALKLINSGELLNLNKEKVDVVLDGQRLKHHEDCHYFLVRDKEDSAGASKSARLHQTIHQGWLWEVSGSASIEDVLATNIFANPHAQEMWRV